ncbi:DUF305 domain-containing protein [Actinomadura barringtoniae]|uniref:DUF305 domain-containing protein n=1 Tax=Actinomadura barringtoniae TaxID=1427535 RepID=A0A939P7L1_9ACTN|nr:DUF305 domain-containing protein [Actinomadura barringtoniae]MBO2447043.1 DUF305 domain-containing protein [Actinomadura barringtoniae]
MKKQFLAIGASAIVLFGAAACGGDDAKGDDGHSGGMASHGMSASPSAPAAQGHNEHDVTFAQMMIPHHRQAVEMSEVVLAGSKNPQVRKLAEQIRNAQDPEIQTMSGWLKQWGAGSGDMGGMAGMHHEMPGMMGAKDMAAFGRLKGAALDRRFLTMMIEHHQGAVTMAGTEQAKGSYPQAKALADSIIKAQQAEIATMRGLLKSRS